VLCLLLSSKKVVQVILLLERAKDSMEDRARWSNDSFLLSLCSQGDSGGPLVCHNVAQGIVSYGPIDRTAPQVFTKVSHFLQWIENTMNHR
jgi:secreted trypsin-like serine protease